MSRIRTKGRPQLAVVQSNLVKVPLAESLCYEPRTGIVKMGRTIRSNFYVYRLEKKYLAKVKLAVQGAVLTEMGLVPDDEFLLWCFQKDLGGGNALEHHDDRMRPLGRHTEGS